jgi:hypothetical protein
VFSNANLFSNPMSQAIPSVFGVVEGIVSLMIGIRARGSILT